MYVDGQAVKLRHRKSNEKRQSYAGFINTLPTGNRTSGEDPQVDDNLVSSEQEVIVYKQWSEEEESWLKQSERGDEQVKTEGQQKQDSQQVQQQSGKDQRQTETTEGKCVQPSADKITRKRRKQQEVQQELQQSVEEVIKKRQRSTPKWLRDYEC